MIRSLSIIVQLRRRCRVLCCTGIWAWAGCVGPLPSTQLNNEVHLPIPQSSREIANDRRFFSMPERPRYELSARSVIPVTFEKHPSVKSSLQRFKSEEARYDFFVTSRDSLTPRLAVSNSFAESRANELATRDRSHGVELSIEKLFFDTTELNVGVGFQSMAEDQAIGDSPYVTASLRYPLWVSRQKLERTSEEIFRRNELDDTQLSYIQEVRNRLQSAMFQFYEVADLGRQKAAAERWRTDLETLVAKLETLKNRDIASDRRRVLAEASRVSSVILDRTGRYLFELERLKEACGIPFDSETTLIDKPFNPFAGATHEELFRLGVATDPEIATLRNSVRNAEVQLDLARRGRWDFSLLVDGMSHLEGRGEIEGVSDWSVLVGVEVSAVDSRVTNSLIRQAEANIARFAQAITARENVIFVDTFEPVIRLETLSESRVESIGNLPRFQQDYESGVERFLAGTLNVDDLMKRRETLFDQEQEISNLTFLLGANVAELCSATGKFFDVLSEDRGG